MHRMTNPGWFPWAVAAVAATVSVTAQAEYRCDKPALQEDQRACALAQRNSPDELRRFVAISKRIYGLYFYDYVRDGDQDRWDNSQQKNAAAEQPEAVKVSTAR
jgi:hypothetical protein